MGGSVIGRGVWDIVLAVRTTVACAIEVMKNPPRRGGCGVIGTVHRRPVAQIIHLALLQKSVILILVPTGGGGTHTGPAGTEVILVLLEVVGWVRIEGGLGLGGEGRVRHGIGEGTGATEVHHVAEGHPCCDGEEDAMVVFDVRKAAMLSGGRDHVQDNNADNGRCRADVAFSFIAVRPIGASRATAGGCGALGACGRGGGAFARTRGTRGARVLVAARRLSDGLSLSNI